jgi:hypothetical protein
LLGESSDRQLQALPPFSEFFTIESGSSLVKVQALALSYLLSIEVPTIYIHFPALDYYFSDDPILLSVHQFEFMKTVFQVFCTSKDSSYRLQMISDYF